jgi:phospholipid/cholesterol/gamma-HCH transport system permease protein
MLSTLVRFFINCGNNASAAWNRALQVIWFIGELAHASFESIKKPHKIRWRDTLYYMDMCGREAFVIVSLICFFMGLILGFQAAVQMHKVGADIFVADLVGFSILKELGPLMVALICTGRAGSAFAAEIGTMKVNEEIDAMTTMGFEPTRFLVMPKMIALVIVMPLLTVIGDFFGLLGGLCVGKFQLGLQTGTYIDRTMQVLGPVDLSEGIIKSIVFAVLISGVGCLRGLQSKADAQGVGRSATSAVVSGIFLVILSDTLLTMLFTGMKM